MRGSDSSGFITGADGRVHGIASQSTESPKELVGRPLADVLNPVATETLLARIDEASETGDRQSVSFGDERFWRGASVTSLPRYAPRHNPYHSCVQMYIHEFE